MIGMMYLVYTALLAMNVSADILDAFAIVNDGQEKTNASIEMKLNEQYLAFENQYNKEPEKTQICWDQAQLIREKTDSVVNYIENLKLYLLLKTENITINDLWNPKDPEKVIINEGTDTTSRRISYRFNLSNISSKDNYDAPTAIMIESEKKATELKHIIQNYRNFIINLVEEAGVKCYSKHVGLLTDTDQSGEPIKYYNKSNQDVTWEQKHFDKVIFVAEMALLNKFVGEIQNTEYDALSELSRQIGASEFRFNNLEARVFPKSSYIIQGQNYEADVFIVAQDTTKQFDIRYQMGVSQFDTARISSAQTVQSVNGTAKLNFPARNIGAQRYAGIIEIADPVTGEIQPYPFAANYTVAPPSVTVSPTKMMILYEEIENPVSVAAAGYTDEDISFTVEGATYKRADGVGNYLFEVNKNTKEVFVNIFAKESDGKTIGLGTQKFRVKPVPKPVVKLNGVKGNKEKKEIIALGGKLLVKMEDVDFEGLEYTVKSYEVSLYNGKTTLRETNKGAGFKNNEKVMQIISSATSGQTIKFSNIRVLSPKGVERTLDDYSIEID